MLPVSSSLPKLVFSGRFTCFLARRGNSPVFSAVSFEDSRLGLALRIEVPSFVVLTQARQAPAGFFSSFGVRHEAIRSSLEWYDVRHPSGRRETILGALKALVDDPSFLL